MDAGSRSAGPSRPRRILVILNPACQQGHGAEREGDIRQGLQGQDIYITQTERPGHAQDLAIEGARQGYDVIVIAGGDGTIHEVITGLLHFSQGQVTPTVALIPIGTGNDLAFTLGMQANDVATACRRILSGVPWLMDAGRIVDERGVMSYFCNSTGAGFDAAVAIETKSLKLSGFTLYLVAVLRVIAKLKPAAAMTVTYNGNSLTQPMLMAGVTNGRRAGGGFLLTPDAKLNDGLLDLCLVREVSKPRIFRLIPLFMQGTHVAQPVVTIGRAPQIIIESPDPLPVYADGEVLRTDARRLEFTVLPARIPVLVERK